MICIIKEFKKILSFKNSVQFRYFRENPGTEYQFWGLFGTDNPTEYMVLALVRHRFGLGKMVLDAHTYWDTQTWPLPKRVDRIFLERLAACAKSSVATKLYLCFTCSVLLLLCSVNNSSYLDYSMHTSVSSICLL